MVRTLEVTERDPKKKKKKGPTDFYRANLGTMRLGMRLCSALTRGCTPPSSKRVQGPLIIQAMPHFKVFVYIYNQQLIHNPPSSTSFSSTYMW